MTDIWNFTFFSLFQPLKPKMHSEIVGMGRVEFGLGFGFLIMGLLISPKIFQFELNMEIRAIKNLKLI